MESKKYYGDKEVASIGEKNNDGLFLVSFADGTSEEMSDLVISNAITEKPLNPTELRDKRAFPIVAEILKLLLKYNVRIGEIDFITDRVIISINESCKRGNEMLWGSPSSDQTMIQVERVLSGGKKDDIPSPFDKEING